jgi:hypothetical protein
MQGLVPFKPLCLEYIHSSISNAWFKTSSESDYSHHSGEESDREGSGASSNESEMPDTRKRRLKPQIIGKAWILRGEIATNLLNNDSGQVSMDGDADYDAKVQNTKSQQKLHLGQSLKI